MTPEPKQEINANAQIARAATSWTQVFPGRKEIDRKIAETCRTAMSLARNRQKTPHDCLAEACKINNVAEDEVLEALNEMEGRP